ncbi:MAG TPA: aconitate hydratase AcnA [Thermoanaerobaculia bacterium]|nr:aconitate hydratase AcnA [Thermoanaerobaculia bacterium]
MTDSFRSHDTLQVAGRSFRFARLGALEDRGHRLSRLPYALRILLENLLRREDGESVRAEDIEALAAWDPKAEPSREIAFMPARVLLQDFTGVPAVVDLAAMRDAMRELGGDPGRINPLQPVELVIDHSVQVDEYGSEAALLINSQKEFERNRERYLFLRWGQGAFRNFRVVPPSTGIVHQVNLEYLARVVMDEDGWAYPDTLVGTDSHTTMINGLGVLGWGVGGIEAEAAMLGQPVSMLIPQVVGFRLTGKLPAGATATDLVLTVTQQLRAHGVVGKFVEFFGPGLAGLRLADRATIANMAPEYGATCGIFPVDRLSLDYLAFSGREPERVELVEAYLRAQGLFHDESSPEPEYSDRLELDLGTVEPSLAGPRRPQDRVALADVKSSFLDELPGLASGGKAPAQPRPTVTGRWEGEGGATAVAEEIRTEVALEIGGASCTLSHGSVVIAAITSCTNTSNPAVMIAAGLVARKAVERGLGSQPWVKTSLAPGSKVVTEYLRESGLLGDLEKLGFNVVGYGCTTCIGNSGPLPAPVSRAIAEGQLVAAAVLSGNRNFEGRISSEVRANYLASPPLVVAYALAGRVDLDLTSEPLGTGSDGSPVYLRDLWPGPEEIEETLRSSLREEMFRSQYADVFHGDDNWRGLAVPEGETFDWDPESTYVRRPPYFEGMSPEPAPVEDIRGARCLALLGDSITTDHISPAGSIKKDSPGGRYLVEHGVAPTDFNSYGSRRGNHEVMVRGTFANVRIRNRMVPGTEGGFTALEPGGEPLSIYDAAMRRVEAGTPLVVVAGKEYGTGSSRDWAAKGPALQGVRAVLAESFERIHRSNLIGMGIVPLELTGGATAADLGLDGFETFSILGLADGVAGGFTSGREVTVRIEREGSEPREIRARVRLDTPKEVEYYRHGGILRYVLRQLLREG